MTTIEPSVFKQLQAYGGLKEAYFEVEAATAADVIDFADNNVEGAKICIAQDSDGAAVTGQICGDDLNTVIIGSGPNAEHIRGVIKYRSY